MNKKGGVGKELILALASIFSLSILVLIFNGIFAYNLYPMFVDLLPLDIEVGQEALSGINSWMTYWKFIPYLILGSILVYMIIVVLKRTPEERYLN